MQVGDDAFFIGSVAVGGTVRLPLLIQDRPAFDRAWAAEAPFLKAAYERKGIVVLGHYTFPINVIWSRKKLTPAFGPCWPENPRDLAGAGRIHSYSWRYSGDARHLGVAAALDRGVIDGVTTASSGYGYIWRDLLKYRYNLDISFIDSLILVNKQAWSALSPQLANHCATRCRRVDGPYLRWHGGRGKHAHEGTGQQRHYGHGPDAR